MEGLHVLQATVCRGQGHIRAEEGGDGHGGVWTQGGVTLLLAN